ncbi:hypothetical protein L596_015293 [Steinernema carpocapsae]|uniref:RRM domain-containing protein n=1 Tax=Steinernema carpocapsae TaxID=34508 RepID=A0A4V6A324_STECR|nr:hypothetical protein L596_015293 [Steinernema carpocapsae]
MVISEAMLVPPPPEELASAVSSVDNLGLAERSILVTNLLSHTTIPMMHTLFENSGPVEHVILRKSTDGTQNAMVLFCHKPSVKFAVQSFDNCLFCGQIIRVAAMATPPPKLAAPPAVSSAAPPASPGLPKTTYKVPRRQFTAVSNKELEECQNCEICQMFRARFSGGITIDDIIDMLPPVTFPMSRIPVLN